MSKTSWLTFLRGLVEKYIDKILSDESLADSRTLFEAMKPAVNSSDDAVFGYVYGYVIGALAPTFSVLNRKPTDEEKEEIANTIIKRTNEIRTRINETKT